MIQGLMQGLRRRFRQQQVQSIRGDAERARSGSAGKGHRSPRLAIVTSGTRSFPGIRRISDARSFADFMASSGEPLFFKLNRGIGSWGAFICGGEKDGKLITTPYGLLTAAEPMQNKIHGRDYLVQRILPNHTALRPLSSALSTIRTTNFFINGQLITPICIMKLAGGLEHCRQFLAGRKHARRS